MRDHANRRQAVRRAGQKPEAVPLQAVDFLLAVDDASRVGALRFQDEAGVFCRAPEPGRRTAPPLIELKPLLSATRAVETENETAADLAYLRGPYFRISRGRASEILNRIERALSQWRKRALALGMTNQQMDQFADAFEHPEREPHGGSKAASLNEVTAACGSSER